jgi:hypothetical protein
MHPTVTAYLQCALWISGEWSEREPWTIANLAPESRARADADCTRFMKQAGALLDDWSAEQVGRDFWLTRNRHGTGFWARSWGTEEQRDKLTDLAHSFGEIYCYLGDDGKVYLA